MSDRAVLEMGNHVKCPRCGAPLKGRRIQCDFCKAELESVISREELKDSCIALAGSVNKALKDVSTPGLIIFFFLFVVLIPVSVFLLMKALNVGGVVPWIIAGIMLLGGFVVFGFFVEREEEKLFKRDLQPRIDRFLVDHQVEMVEFMATVKSVLKESDPLYKYLDKISF